MLSAPPVLVMPESVVVPGEHSPVTHDTFEWATQTPEPSPICLMKTPQRTFDEQLCNFKVTCHPIFEQMLARIASHADILANAEPLVRHQLVQSLSQPFFEHISETLCEEISSADFPSHVEANEETLANLNALGKHQLNLEQSLGFWEEGSTDADDGSAFASLLSSDGEECELQCRKEASMSSQSAWLHVTPVSPLEEDIDSLQDVEKSSMVCRHWKAKGWCRYASECKFSHPGHKQGIGARGPTDMIASRSARGRRRRECKSQTAKVPCEVPRECVVALSTSTCFPQSRSMYSPHATR